MIDTNKLYQQIIDLAESDPYSKRVEFLLERLEELDEKAYKMCSEHIATAIIGG